MTTEQLIQDLRSFFFKVNNLRTDVMRKENPNEIYEHFANEEPDELVIRRGMSQYEDLAKYFKKKGRHVVTFTQPEPKYEPEPEPEEVYHPPPKKEIKEKLPKKNVKKEKVPQRPHHAPKIRNIHKEEEEERPQIIKTGIDSAKMKANQDFLKKMLESRGGMVFGMRMPSQARTESTLSQNQVTNIEHGNNEEGKNEEVLISTSSIQKGKKKAKKKFMTENLNVDEENPNSEVQKEENEKNKETAKEKIEQTEKKE